MKFRIDPELQYCPQCQDEYRAGIVTCASCAVELLSGQQMLDMIERQKNRLAGRSMEITPEDELVDIMKGQVINIKNVKSMLKHAGLPSIIAGDSSSCGKGCCGGEVRLQVRAADLREVQEVLHREYLQTTGLLDHDTSFVNAVFNPDAGDAVCPACGYSFSTTSKTCPECGLCF